MKPGNDEQVKGSGPLEAGPEAVIQAGPIAEEHRVEHLRIRLSKPQKLREMPILRRADKLLQPTGSPCLGTR